MMETFFVVIVGLITLKAVTVGSEFSFFYWYKYRGTYLDWYDNQESFYDYLKENNIE